MAYPEPEWVEGLFLYTYNLILCTAADGQQSIKSPYENCKFLSFWLEYFDDCQSGHQGTVQSGFRNWAKVYMQFCIIFHRKIVLSIL